MHEMTEEEINTNDTYNNATIDEYDKIDVEG